MPVQLHSRSADDEGDEARIEVVPLIDIMFFLLAAFMLVSLSMTHMKRVPINLPDCLHRGRGNQGAALSDRHRCQRRHHLGWKIVTLSEITAA
jgi:hypothetical protein